MERPGPTEPSPPARPRASWASTTTSAGSCAADTVTPARRRPEARAWPAAREQRGRHVVAAAPSEPVPHVVRVHGEVAERQLGPSPTQEVAVGAAQGGAGHDRAGAPTPPYVDPVSDGLQPGPAVGVGQRDTAAILDTFAGGCRSSPSTNSQPTEAASAWPTVVLRTLRRPSRRRSGRLHPANLALWSGRRPRAEMRRAAGVSGHQRLDEQTVPTRSGTSNTSAANWLKNIRLV
jgi:hypothetical protein